MAGHYLQTGAQAALEMWMNFCQVGKWLWTLKSTGPELAHQWEAGSGSEKWGEVEGNG